MRVEGGETRLSGGEAEGGGVELKKMFVASCAVVDADDAG